MFASLTKTAAVAALAFGLALAGPVVTSADAAMRHGAGTVHGAGVHNAGVQRGRLHGGNRGYAGANHGGHRERYGYGGYGYGYGYGCPLFPIGLIVGQCY